MALSKCFLKAKYTGYQYAGALLVCLGLFFAVLPTIDAPADPENGEKQRWKPETTTNATTTTSTPPTTAIMTAATVVASWSSFVVAEMMRREMGAVCGCWW